MYSEKDIQALDIERAKHFEPKSLQKYKANQAQSQTAITEFFDQDVKEMLFKHNNAHDRARVNTVLRALFA